MNEYIIKNCPATGAGCCGDTCPEITDCPLKQIVEKCKKAQEYHESFIRIDDILDDLDIQEVE